MKVRLQLGGIMQPPDIRVGVDSFVLYTEEGMPIAAAVEMDGKVLVTTAGEPDFHRTLLSLGFDKAKLPPELEEVKIAAE